MDNEIMISENEILGENIICKSEILITNENDDSINKCEDLEYAMQENNTAIQFVSVPIINDLEVKISWTRQMTKALIQEYTIMLSQFKNPEKRQKDLWISLAKRLNDRGYNVSWSMCDRKFRNLKQTYRTIYYSERSEKSKRRWEFFDDLSVIITPYSRFLLNKKGQVDPSGSSSSTFEDSSVLLNTLLEQENKTNPENFLAECDGETPQWFKNFMVQFKKEQDNMIDNIRTMHQEMKAVELRKVKLLETIIAMLKTKS